MTPSLGLSSLLSRMHNSGMGSTPEKSSELQRQVEEIRDRMAVNRADIDALQVRAEEAYRLARAREEQLDQNHHRIEELETRVDVDRALICELRAEDMVNQERSAHLEEALRTSREIGAAIGILMASRRLTEEASFALLVRTSQHTNRKVRDLAAEVVRTGDLSMLLEA